MNRKPFAAPQITDEATLVEGTLVSAVTDPGQPT
jgi:hypothetical protein